MTGYSDLVRPLKLTLLLKLKIRSSACLFVLTDSFFDGLAVKKTSLFCRLSEANILARLGRPCRTHDLEIIQVRLKSFLGSNLLKLGPLFLD